jgi:hypothetical protein
MRTATFALFIGFAYVSAGVLGLVPAALTPPPEDAPPVSLAVLYGYVLGVFPVNALHSAVHLLIGLWGVIAWRTDHFGRGMGSPKTYARALAIFYGALAVLGLIPALYTLGGLLPIHGNDVWLHAGTAAAAAYFGWRTETEVERRARERTDRRQEARPVQVERRRGHSDRRVPGSEV